MFRSFIAELERKPKSDRTEGADEPLKQDAKKRKAETDADTNDELPSSKEAKTDATPKKAEEPDMPPDDRQALRAKIGFETVDTTLNVVPIVNSSLLMSLSEGGLQSFLAGARANVGIKSGCYMYEVRIMELLNPEATTPAGRLAKPKQVLRIGFSLAGSDLVSPQDKEEGVFFDSEGAVWTSKTSRKQAGSKWSRNDIIALALNTKAESSEEKATHTVTLFRNGDRIGVPTVLPANLQGKTLFPHIVYRNVTINYNFGPNTNLDKHLALKHRMLQTAAEADTDIRPSLAQRDGKYEVLFPVSLPDQGSFIWLDKFLENHPSYVELSDRRLREWAVASGLEMAFPKKSDSNNSIKSLHEDLSLQRVVKSVAPLVPRNYIVMEVSENLVRSERIENAARFSQAHYKKVARVMIGEPSIEYKKHHHDKLLQVKAVKLKDAWKKKQALKEKIAKQEAAKARQAAIKKTHAEKVAAVKAKQEEAARIKKAKAKADAQAALKKAQKAKAEKERKEKIAKGEAVEEEDKDEDEADKEDDEEKAEKEDDEEKAEGDEVQEDDKAEEGADQAATDDKGDKKAEDAKEPDDEDAPPEPELTDEEKDSWHPAVVTNDLTDSAFARSFGRFSVPALDEGFDDIMFEWQTDEKSREYLSSYIGKHKLTTLYEDLASSKLLKAQAPKWIKAFSDYQVKLKKFKSQQKDEQLDLPEDLSDVKDVCDIGEGVPLFAEFEKADWALLNLRYEFFLIMRVYQKELEDGECIGIPEGHIAFYYQKFFGKVLLPKNFGMGNLREMLRLVKDTVAINEEKSTVITPLADDVSLDDFGSFIKLTEEARRHRARLLDIGDESGELNFTGMAFAAPQIASNVAETKAETSKKPVLKPVSLQKTVAPSSFQSSATGFQSWANQWVQNWY